MSKIDIDFNEGENNGGVKLRFGRKITKAERWSRMTTGDVVEEMMRGAI